MTDKASLRAQVREAIRALTAEQRTSESHTLCELALKDPRWQEAGSVLLFARLPDEPDLTPLVESAWRSGKSVALPRFDSTAGVYAAAIVRSTADLSPGRFGVLEPAAHCPSVSLKPLDLVFVPGVAFDFTGRRLGRGKGFYDRLLAEVSGHKCGVAFTAQVIATVPEEPHDIRVNSLLTPTVWRMCQSAA